MRDLMEPRVSFSAMGWLSFLRDLRSTIDAWSPHAMKAAELERRSMGLLFEARDENAELTEAERASRREEARRLWEEARREGPAIHQPWEDLAARHPGRVRD
jgi:hypothetical protein